jgi:tetratricopeptide (TPR) repeat protein
MLMESRYMFECGLHLEAEQLLNLAQQTYPQDSNNLLSATISFNLAGLRFECNRMDEARVLCHRAMEMREALLSPNDPLLANTYYSMAIVYMENGELDLSLAYNLKALDVRNAVDALKGHDDAPTAFAYGNLGLCYWRRGEYGPASSCMEKAEEMWRNSCGRESDKYAR